MLPRVSGDLLEQNSAPECTASLRRSSCSKKLAQRYFPVAYSEEGRLIVHAPSILGLLVRRGNTSCFCKDMVLLRGKRVHCTCSALFERRVLRCHSVSFESGTSVCRTGDRTYHANAERHAGFYRFVEWCSASRARTGNVSGTRADRSHDTASKLESV